MALNDRELLARTLQAEAGNQGFGGMIAAGSVIMNRLGSNGSLRNVILKPGQFSAWNSVTKYAGGEQGQNMDFTPSAEAYKAADALLSGKYQDPTGGATHYYNPSISTPSWGQEAGGQWTKIGAHLFGTPSGEKRTTTPRANAREVSPMDGQQPMQQQMPQQGPQGLMGFLRDPRTRQVLSAFSRSGVGQRLGQIAAQDVQRQEQQQTANRTAEWLEAQPNGSEFANLVRTGVLTGSQGYAAYMQQRAKGESQMAGAERMQQAIAYLEGINRPDLVNLITANPAALESVMSTITKQAVEQPDEKEINKAILERRKEFTSLPEVKEYKQYVGTFGKIIKSAQRKSAAADLALVFNYMKMLDPASVVRESEFQAAAQAGTFGDKIKASVDRIATGKLLTDAQRNDFVNVAKDYYDSATDQYADIARQYSSFAEQAGVDPSRVVPDIKFLGQVPDLPDVTPTIEPKQTVSQPAAPDSEGWTDIGGGARMRKKQQSGE